LQTDDVLNALIDQLSLWQIASIALEVCVVIVEDQLVDINLADSRRDASLCDLVGESVCTMKNNAYASCGLLPDGL